ncbi:MAG: FitA-like ribbon-helix-helix domain-containing protein [Planctomycetota bacterium]|jgi:hypothetical protein|nr:ribbon-helix-helix domain-containing protein [Planctomycetota bacterium]
MKAITIHGLEEPVWALLQERAKEQGASINATVKGILEQALGVKRVRQQPHRRDFEEFCGMWSPEEADAFGRATIDDRRVDPDDWR